MDSMDEIREELRQPALDLREMIPDVMKGFAGLSRRRWPKASFLGSRRSSSRSRSRRRASATAASSRTREVPTRRRDAPADGRGDGRGDRPERWTGHGLGSAGLARVRRGARRANGRRKLVLEMLDAVDEARLQLRRLPFEWMRVATQKSRNITVISRRARCAPRQKCGPGAPKP